jgi:hypothetical protein
MPVTTPKEHIGLYQNDSKHFVHVLEHLFIPALEKVGFEPIHPTTTGSDVIHADIIQKLSSCELVLCDMSILNPNVFFEFGIRTALNKAVVLVVDDKTEPIPFDTGIINFHKYNSSLAPWILEEEKKALTEHIRTAYEKISDYNALWKYFGIAQTGIFKPEDATLGEKIDLLINEVSALNKQQKELKRFISPRGIIPRSSRLTEYDSIYELLQEQKRQFPPTYQEMFLGTNSQEDKAKQRNKVIDD